MEEDEVRQYFSKVDIHKSMGRDGKHSRVLMSLADVIVRPLSITFEGFWGVGEVPEDWRKANNRSSLEEGQEGGPRELQASQPHLDPWEDGGAANPGNHFQAHEGQERHQE